MKMKIEIPKLKFNWNFLLSVYRGIITFLVLCILAFVTCLLSLISFGRLRKFNNRYIASWFSRILLFLLGVSVDFPSRDEYPNKKVLYIFNHNSNFDPFLLFALGLPGCEFIASVNTNDFLPLRFANLGLGTHCIPLQINHEERTNFFQKLTKRFKEKDICLIGSPEGNHNYIHGISKFNKGLFHMALETNVDICPIFIGIKKENNPFKSIDYKAGHLKVEILPLVSTENWNLIDLNLRVEEVREIYMNHFEKVNH